MHRGARWLTGGVLAALLAGPSAARAPDVGLFAEVLAPDAPSEGPEREALLRRLTGLGVSAVPDVFDLLVDRELVLAGDAPPLPVDAVDEELLFDALRSWPAGRVAERIVASAKGGDLRERLIALRALGEIARSESVPPLLEHLGAFDDVEAQHPLVRDAVATALAGLLRRDDRGFDELADELIAFPPTHFRALVDALAAARRGASLPLLRAMLGRGEEMDVAVLTAVGELPRWDEVVRDGQTSWILNAHLRAESPKVRRQAVLALGALRDCEAFEPLLGLLGDPDRRVRLAALTALRSLSGLRWPADVDRWLAYFHEESTWYASELSETLDRLSSSDAHVVVDALRRLPEHPLFRVEVSLEVAPLLESRDESVAVSACAALARLDSAAAVGPLLDALADPRPAVAAGAWNALRAITRLELPPDEAAWRDALAL